MNTTAFVPREKYEAAQRGRAMYVRLYDRTFAELSEVKAELEHLRHAQPDAAHMADLQQRYAILVQSLSAAIKLMESSASALTQGAAAARAILESAGRAPAVGSFQ